MRNNMGTTGCQEDVHLGQCFEEFYGAEYCKNLKKDLEKLKDEFYDGKKQRFQREWVIPTADLLRRLLHMGFPVRTREYIVIHLYNPVDSMFAGEMHFQVGRKGPGTLTLKFTKQTTNGMFIIQPKTLSNDDEKKLCENPLEFLQTVRNGMTGLVVDTASLLQVMVLMTETCKLHRQCAKLFFSNLKAKIGPVAPNSHLLETSSNLPLASLPYPTNQWTGAALMNPLELSSLRPESNFSFPLKFYVKNYVNCNTKSGLEAGGAKSVVSQQQHQSTTSNGHHVSAGITYRQARSSTWHSEPEENDETLELQSFNESSWPRQPPDSIDEIQRRMADAHLWDATKEPVTAASATPAIISPSQRLKSSAQLSSNNIIDHRENAIETKVLMGEMRTSLTDEYTQDSNVASGTDGPEKTRKISEHRTAATDGYVGGVGGSNSPVESQFGSSVLSPQVLSQNAGVTGCLTMQRETNGERTSLTEEYAGDVSVAPNCRSAEFGVRRKDNILKDGFIEPSSSKNQDSRLNPRTSVVNDYACEVGMKLSNNSLYPPQGRGVANGPMTQSPVYGRSPVSDFREERRTSSLDGYIGNPSVTSTDSSGSNRVHSDSSLNNNTRYQRTSLVDQYFQEVSKSLDDGQGNGILHQSSSSSSFPSSRMIFHGTADSPQVEEDPQDMSWSGAREMTHGNSLDSWMSHAGPIPSQSERTAGSNETDMSLLSHASFASWASHPCIPTGANPGGRVLIPLAVEEINKNAKSWK